MAAQLLKFIEEAVFDKETNLNDPEIVRRKQLWEGLKQSAASMTNEEFILNLLHKMKGDEIINLAALHELIVRVSK
ncbi:MAG TPA: hypothetical protein VNT20_18305 [Flavisolibacter sp.]|jgi:hypothetical protein|nr:hypothetical protein [Flavisolibacter sp.]